MSTQGSKQAARRRAWRKKWLAILGGVAVGVAAFLFLAMIATDPGDNAELLESGARPGPAGERFVTGTLRNNTRGTYFRAELEISLLGRDGAIVGTTVASTRDFTGTWRFEAPVLVDDAVRFRMKKLTCSKSEQSSDWEKRRSCAIPSGVDRPPYSGDLPLAAR